MSEKKFEMLSKIYKFCKKYNPLILLGLMLVLALCKVDAVIYISIYLVGIVLHLVALAVIQRIIKMHLSSIISAQEMQELENSINGMTSDELARFGGAIDERQDDTKESN